MPLFTTTKGGPRSRVNFDDGVFVAGGVNPDGSIQTLSQALAIGSQAVGSYASARVVIAGGGQATVVAASATPRGVSIFNNSAADPIWIMMGDSASAFPDSGTYPSLMNGDSIGIMIAPLGYWESSSLLTNDIVGYPRNTVNLTVTIFTPQ